MKLFKRQHYPQVVARLLPTNQQQVSKMRRSDPELKTLPTGATCATFSLAYRPPPRQGGGAERPSEW